MDAPNLKSDLIHLKAKIDAGAEYIITQMFFDNKKFFAFVDACRKMGITVPIIPGLKPIQTLKQITILPQVFSIDLPEELMTKLEKCKENKDVRQVGIDWCIKQSKELLEYGVPSLHYYTMSRSKAVHAIASAVFK
jgi:methylenetetrahydrofolate reductase (NADPH)